jgi:drug/metabolite transporter (DMT)-like permease
MFVRWANAPGPVTGLYRVFLATLLLTPFFLQNHRQGSKIKRNHLIFPILGGLFTAGDFALWNTSVHYTTAANATLLGNTAPLWVALGTWLILKRQLSGEFWRGLAITLIGAAVIMGTDFILHPRFGVGDVMAVFTGFFYGGYYLFTEKSRANFDSVSHTWFVGVGASATLLAINFLLGYSFSGYSTQTWLVFLATALVSQLIGYIALAHALGHLPASIVAPTMVLQPVVTALLAIPLLKETPTLYQGFGGAIALVGIYIVNRSHQPGLPETPNA